MADNRIVVFIQNGELLEVVADGEVDVVVVHYPDYKHGKPSGTDKDGNPATITAEHATYDVKQVSWYFDLRDNRRESMNRRNED